MTDDDAELVLRAVAHPVRRAVLRALHEGPKTAGQLAAGFSLAPSTLSGHFSVLRQAGLVEGSRRASTITYVLVPGPLSEVVAELAADFDLPTSPSNRVVPGAH